MFFPQIGVKKRYFLPSGPDAVKTLFFPACLDGAGGSYCLCNYARVTITLACLASYWSSVTRQPAGLLQLQPEARKDGSRVLGPRVSGFFISSLTQQWTKLIKLVLGVHRSGVVAFQVKPNLANGQEQNSSNLFWVHTDLEIFCCAFLEQVWYITDQFEFCPWWANFELKKAKMWTWVSAFFNPNLTPPMDKNKTHQTCFGCAQIWCCCFLQLKSKSSMVEDRTHWSVICIQITQEHTMKDLRPGTLLSSTQI